jgi:hypothetical protein
LMRRSLIGYTLTIVSSKPHGYLPWEA